MIKPRPALFKWRHFEPEIIVCPVRWYLRFSLSYRDVEELIMERSLPVDHTNIWPWVQRYAPELNKRYPWLDGACRSRRTTRTDFGGDDVTGFAVTVVTPLL